MKAITFALAMCAIAVSAVSTQQAAFERLPRDVLDVGPPSERVRSSPSGVTIRKTSCRSLPMAQVRRRIVDLTVQEWGFFGFSVVDEAKLEAAEATNQGAPRTGRSWPHLSPAESARVADSIAGYWSVTPEGSWIANAQRTASTRLGDIPAGWRYPWSAAFVSWVMCEAGLGDAAQFRRAVAHHVYIDQAIRARGVAKPAAAFVAYDIGQAPMTPGDLLCSARRPAYRSIAERGRQLGVGARTHCDIVVKVDAAQSRILVIGGNVRGSVGLKLLPVVHEPDKQLHPVASRPLFAHLRLRAQPIEEDALDRTPTMRALICGGGARPPQWIAALNLLAPRSATPGC
jgi:hypothetical protein